MGFKMLVQKLKDVKISGFGQKAVKRTSMRKKSWRKMSHGFYMVERGYESGDPIADGSAVAHREEVGSMELSLFGIFDQYLGDGMTNYFQKHLFNENLTENRIKKKAQEIMKKAYVSEMAKAQVGEKAVGRGGGATVLVLENRRFVAAYCGEYRVVVCKNGKAKQVKNLWKGKGKWSMSGMFKHASGIGDCKRNKNSEFVVTTQKVASETEFIIVASDGIWQVMKNLEAVQLISHIEDPQKAAELLAEEAINRYSKKLISCIVIRFL